MAKACILVALLAVACSTTVSSALSTGNNGIGTWTDLFQPPYNTTVSYMNGLSCNSDTSCYVYNTTSLLRFNGVPNGTFTPLKTANPSRLITAIVVSGPMDAPGGVMVDYSGNFQFPVDNMTFLASSTPPNPFVNSVDARASTNGQEVLVINTNSPNVLYSSNGGKSFSLKPINVKLADRYTSPQYGCMVDKNTWYVSMGSASGGGYEASAQIVKTTDGGNTWTTQFSQVSNFFFNAIECLSATHCVVIGGSDSGVYIYRTVDGQTWKQVFTDPSTASLTHLRANAHGHLFAAGFKTKTKTIESYILTSVDGGATWVEGSPIPNVYTITGLSFTPGGYGFATALCDFHGNGGSTVLRYDPAPSQPLH